MANISNQQQFGSFLPTSFVWDVAQIHEVNVNTKEFKELLVRMHEFINLIAYNVNLRETGYYVLDEFVNGQLFFPNPSSTTLQNRQAYRKTFNVGPLPNATTKTIPHGITCNVGTTFTRIYGAGSNTTSLAYLPLPFVSSTAVADNIQVTVDSTNIYITTGANYSAYNIAYIILEYLKQ